MKKVISAVIILIVCSGCAAIKAAPDETQKLNAYLLNKTATAAAELAKKQNADEQLCELAELSAKQSEAIVAYYGKPSDAPEQVENDMLLDEQVSDIAQLAYENALAGNDYRKIADNIFDVAIGLCGLFGGAIGIKAASFITIAKNKATALEEIISGNEKFKAANPQYSELFKKAQRQQSAATRQIVTEIKNA